MASPRRSEASQDAGDYLPRMASPRSFESSQAAGGALPAVASPSGAKSPKPAEPLQVAIDRWIAA